MGVQRSLVRPAVRRTAVRCAAVALIAPALSGCGLFGGDGKPGHDESVFKLKAGDCLLPQTQVREELSTVRVVPCTDPHTQEAYAIVRYDRTGIATRSETDHPDGYPGDAVLKKFADGTCARHYGSYVGIDYPDSSLFFTYLLPSARGWQQKDDRDVICFVTTSGAALKTSVKGSRQ